MAADGQIDEGPPLTELESLQLKANNITDESLDSTRRMITLCEEVKKQLVQKSGWYAQFLLKIDVTVGLMGNIVEMAGR